MEKILEHNGQSVTYILRRLRRSKRMSIRIAPGGKCVISVPRFAFGFEINRVLEQKADWIIAKVSEMKKLKPIATKRETKASFLQYKEQALALVTERLKFFNQHYQFTYGSIRIGKQTTRWGSCSRQGNLNFNYKIALIPAAMADYIVVHELCHIGQFNHSKDFWNLVAETVPDYKKLRLGLKKEGKQGIA